MLPQLFGHLLGNGKWLPLNFMVLTKPHVFHSLIQSIGPRGNFTGVGQKYNGSGWFTHPASGQLTLAGLTRKINHITHDVSDAASRVNGKFSIV